MPSRDVDQYAAGSLDGGLFQEWRGDAPLRLRGPGARLIPVSIWAIPMPVMIVRTPRRLSSARGQGVHCFSGAGEHLLRVITLPTHTVDVLLQHARQLAGIGGVLSTTEILPADSKLAYYGPDRAQFEVTSTPIGYDRGLLRRRIEPLAMGTTTSAGKLLTAEPLQFSADLAIGHTAFSSDDQGFQPDWAVLIRQARAGRKGSSEVLVGLDNGR